MTPQEMLSAMEVGGGLAARAQQFDLSRQKLALDQAQVNLQMAHEQAKFPLQIQGLEMVNESNKRALDLQKKGMEIQAEDEQTMTNWQLENMDNPYAVLTNPPQVKTLGMLKQVAEMQAIIGKTAKGIQMTKQAIGTDPAVQALIEERKATAEASKARAEFYRRPTTTKGFAPTAGMKESEYADDLREQAASLEAEGDYEAADGLRKTAAIFEQRLTRGKPSTSGMTPAQQMELLKELPSNDPFKKTLLERLKTAAGNPKEGQPLGPQSHTFRDLGSALWKTAKFWEGIPEAYRYYFGASTSAPTGAAKDQDPLGLLNK